MRTLALCTVAALAFATVAHAMERTPVFGNERDQIGNKAWTVLNDFAEASERRLKELDRMMTVVTCKTADDLKKRRAEWTDVLNEQVAAWTQVQKDAGAAYFAYKSDGKKGVKRLPENYMSWLNGGMRLWGWFQTSGEDLYYSVKRAEAQRILNEDETIPDIQEILDTMSKECVELDKALVAAYDRPTRRKISDLESKFANYPQRTQATHTEWIKAFDEFIKKEVPAKKTDRLKSLEQWQVLPDSILAPYKQNWIDHLKKVYKAYKKSHANLLLLHEQFKGEDFMSTDTERIKDWSVADFEKNFQEAIKELTKIRKRR